MEKDKIHNKHKHLPIPVKRAMLNLGGDIRNARLRRRITSELLAERASISRTTLFNIEKGYPGVSMGAYASVLMSLGMIDRLSNIADIKHDEIGLALEDEQLPKRIRRISYARQ